MTSDPLVRLPRFCPTKSTTDQNQAAHLAFVTSPLQAGPLYTTFKDLALCEFPPMTYHTYAQPVPFLTFKGWWLTRIAVEWQDLRAMVLPGTEWAVIIGHKRPSVRSSVQMLPLTPITHDSYFPSLSVLDPAFSYHPLPMPYPPSPLAQCRLSVNSGLFNLVGWD